MSKRAGLTLLELVVTMGVGIIILTLGSLTWINSAQDFTQVNTVQEDTTLFTDSFNRVTNQVRTAIEFPTSYTDPNGTSYSVNPAGDTTLILKQYAIKNDVGQVDCTKFDYVVYQQNGTTLLEKVFPDPASKRGAHITTIFDRVQSLSLIQTKSGTAHREIKMTLTAPNSQISLPALSHEEIIVARND